MGALKEFADGSLGSRTALFYQPYTDTPTPVYGTRVTPLPTLERWAQAAHAAGLQVAVHAIGDRAVEEVGGMLGRVRGGGGRGRGVRHRIEHAQHMASDATPGMLAAAGV